MGRKNGDASGEESGADGEGSATVAAKAGKTGPPGKGSKGGKGGKGGKPAPPVPDAYGLGAAFDPAVLAERPSIRQLNKWKQGDLLHGIPIGWVGDTHFDRLTGYDFSLVASSSGESAHPGDPDLTADPVEPVKPAEFVEPAQPVESAGPAAGSPGSQGSPRSRMVWTMWEEVNNVGDPAMSEEGWGVVISQTCDIVAKGPGARHGTVQVAPVVLGTGNMPADRVDAAKLGKVVELVHVPALTKTAKGGDWFADLRMSIPVSKGVLLSRDPIEGFNSQDGRLELAEAVASKYRRAASHDAVADFLIPALSKLVEDAVENGEAWPEGIEQIRLLIRQGDRLEPKKVQLLAILHSRLSTEDRKPLREFRAKNRREFKRLTTADPDATPPVPGVAGGCEMAPCRFESKHKLSIAEYRGSVPLDVSGLDGSFW